MFWQTLCPGPIRSRARSGLSSWRCSRNSARSGGPLRHLIQSPLFDYLFHDLQALGTDAFLHSWDSLLAYGFPPWALIPQVLRKLCSSFGVLMTLIAPYWPQRPWFPDLNLVVDSPVALPSCPNLLNQPHFHRRHLGIHRLSFHTWRLQQFARAEVFSARVAAQVGFARRCSSWTNYQIKWSVYHRWCHSKGHSISRPSMSKVADFLFWLCRSKNL